MSRNLLWDVLIALFCCRAAYYGVQSYALELGQEYLLAAGATGLMELGIGFAMISLMGRVMGSPEEWELEEIQS